MENIDVKDSVSNWIIIYFIAQTGSDSFIQQTIQQ
jgi:hypothetical protein